MPSGPLLYHRLSCKHIRLFSTTGHATNTAGFPLQTVQDASISGSSLPQAMLQIQQALLFKKACCCYKPDYQHIRHSSTTVQTASISDSSLLLAMLQTQQAFLYQKAAASSPLLYHKTINTLILHFSTTGQAASTNSRPFSTTSHAANTAGLPLTIQTASISDSSLLLAMLQTQQAFLYQKAAASSPLLYHKLGYQHIRPSSTTGHAAKYKHNRPTSPKKHVASSALFSSISQATNKSGPPLPQIMLLAQHTFLYQIQCCTSGPNLPTVILPAKTKQVANTPGTTLP